MTPLTADPTQEMSEVEEANATVLNGLFDDPAESSSRVARPTAEVQAILESLLFVSPEPIPIARLVAVLEDVTKAEAETALLSLEQALEQDGRGIRLAKVAGGYRLVTKHEYAPWVKRLDKTKSIAKLSRSALESLAIIAYKQPLIRAEIEEIRGVETSGVLRTLLERKLVRIVGRKEVPGRPIMYGTTKLFLEHFGLHDLSQLPPLREFKELGEAEQALVPADEEGVLSHAPSSESTEDHGRESVSDELNGSTQSGDVQDSLRSITEEEVSSYAAPKESCEDPRGEFEAEERNGAVQLEELLDPLISRDDIEVVSLAGSAELAEGDSEESELDELISSIPSAAEFQAFPSRGKDAGSLHTTSVEPAEVSRDEPVSGEVNGFHPQQ